MGSQVIEREKKAARIQTQTCTLGSGLFLLLYTVTYLHKLMIIFLQR